MEPVTYSLKSGKKDIQGYYENIEKLTDGILAHADDMLMPIVEGYTDYLKKFNLEEVREKEEYILELISFGVLWRSYAGVALSVRRAPFVTLSRMADWRKIHHRLKPYIDAARGILITLFMLPDNISESGTLTLEKVDRVCKWFDATGEFKEEALRFIRWRAWWQTLEARELKKVFTAVYCFTDLFVKLCGQSLEKYTPNVESFVKSNAGKYHWREDRIACMRPISEYYLNMVGAVLMNRAFRSDFVKTDKKVLLLPGCMRIRPAGECKAVKVQGGLSCIGCHKECRVNQLREKGKRSNYKVCIIPHASDLSLWSPHKGIKNCGVVASACLSHLIEGGLELKRYDVPAQCVPLDYCGCKKHWDKEGITTEIDICELNRILS
jgi:hypothetical protein